MSVTSAVCLQSLPSWCTAANDEESDKRAAAFLVVPAFTYKLAREKQSVQQRGHWHRPRSLPDRHRPWFRPGTAAGV